jgi:hypothetical protein
MKNPIQQVHEALDKDGRVEVEITTPTGEHINTCVVLDILKMGRKVRPDNDAHVQWLEDHYYSIELDKDIA